MYQGTSESRDFYTGMFFDEDELLKFIDSVTTPGEMWDVYRNGRLAYYYTKENQENSLMSL